MKCLVVSEFVRHRLCFGWESNSLLFFFFSLYFDPFSVRKENTKTQLRKPNASRCFLLLIILHRKKKSSISSFLYPKIHSFHSACARYIYVWNVFEFRVTWEIPASMDTNANAKFRFMNWYHLTRLLSASYLRVSFSFSISGMFCFFLYDDYSSVACSKVSRMIHVCLLLCGLTDLRSTWEHSFNILVLFVGRVCNVYVIESLALH